MKKLSRRIWTGVRILQEAYTTASRTVKICGLTVALTTWAWPLAALRWKGLYLRVVPEPYQPLVPWGLAIGVTILWALWTLLGKIESLENTEQDRLRPRVRIVHGQGGSFFWTNGPARLHRILVENVGGKLLTGVAIQITEIDGRDTAELPLDLQRIHRGSDHRHDLLTGESAYFSVIQDDRANDNAIVPCVLNGQMAAWALGNLERYGLRIGVFVPDGPSVTVWFRVGRGNDGYHTLDVCDNGLK